MFNCLKQQWQNGEDPYLYFHNVKGIGSKDVFHL
jgi:hypothetical protein